MTVLVMKFVSGLFPDINIKMILRVTMLNVFPLLYANYVKRFSIRPILNYLFQTFFHYFMLTISNVFPLL